jgi:inosine-uridine nucleoside N-ribohydrolase
MLSALNISYSSSLHLKQKQPASKIPLIVDTDAGWDDWIALAFLIKNERNSNYKLIGIISNGIGESRLKPGVRNIRNILALAKRTDIPVYEGSQTALRYSNKFPDKFRDSVDTLFKLNLPKSNASTPKISGQKYLEDILSNSKSKINILSIGGLTDLARVIQNNPKTLRKINTLFVMGGSFDLSNSGSAQQPIGNVQDLQPSSSPSNMTAEFNMFIDPKANDIVIKNVKNIVMIPLNACRSVQLSKPFVESLPIKTKLDKFVHTILKDRLTQANKAGYKEYFYDPLSAVIASGRQDVVKLRDYPISVKSVYNSDLDNSGATYINKNGKHVLIAIHASTARFLYYFRQ